jgi:hypothetical protein
MTATRLIVGCGLLRHRYGDLCVTIPPWVLGYDGLCQMVTRTTNSDESLSLHTLLCPSYFSATGTTTAPLVAVFDLSRFATARVLLTESQRGAFKCNTRVISMRCPAILYGPD